MPGWEHGNEETDKNPSCRELAIRNPAKGSLESPGRLGKKGEQRNVRGMPLASSESPWLGILGRHTLRQNEGVRSFLHPPTSLCC